MYDKCDVCLNKRTIVSENGYHTICSLSGKQSTDCLLCKKSYFILDKFKINKEKICLIDRKEIL